MKNQILIQETNFDSARKKIRENKDKLIIFSGNDELNRKILEKEKIDILLLNQSQRKDKQKQRDSGFNQVLAKLAKKSDITIGINLDEIINAKFKEKAEIIARIKQNVSLCKKNKLKMKFITQNEKDTYDLRALGLVLGMPTTITKNL